MQITSVMTYTHGVSPLFLQVGTQPMKCLLGPLSTFAVIREEKTTIMISVMYQQPQLECNLEDLESNGQSQKKE